MLKTISVRDLRLGMYIEKMCGNWVDHPFWRSSFSLADQDDLHTLQTCGLKEVVIDTARGVDVAPGVPPSPAPATPAAAVAVPGVRVSLEQELDRAR